MSVAYGWAVVEGTGQINVRTVTTTKTGARINWLVINEFIPLQVGAGVDDSMIETCFERHRGNAEVESVIISRRGP